MIKNPTVCIITYKREDGLNKLLTELSKQTFKNFNIIITDNASESGVAEVVKQHAGLNIALFKEDRQGISYARNNCIAEFLKTDSDALVWIDDDEWPEHENWIQELIIAKDQAGADIVTSDVVTVPENSNQIFLVNAMRSSLAKDNLASLSKFYTNNTLISRAVIEKIGMLDLFYNQTGSGDLDYALRAKNAGFKTVYAKNAKVLELHPESRSSFKWFALRGLRVGQGATAVSLKQKGSLKTLALTLPYFCFRLLRACVTLFKSMIYLDKGLFCSAILRFGSAVGTLSGLFGFNYKEYKKK